MTRAIAWLGLFLALPALAWTPYRTQVGSDGQSCTLRWALGPVALALDATALDGLADVDVQAIAGTAAASWQALACPLCAVCRDGASATQPCAPEALGATFHWNPRGKPSPVGALCQDLDPDGACRNVASNGNWINFVRDAATWQAQQQSRAVVALTVLTYDRDTGEIRDADVLLDDVGHDFCVAPNCVGDRYDLQSTLTHELGHVLGLDHTTAAEATMNAGAAPGEWKKRSLESDDTVGVCTLYRTTCRACAVPPPTDGCQTAPTPAPLGSLAAVALGAAAIAARRRLPR